MTVTPESALNTPLKVFAFGFDYSNPYTNTAGGYPYVGYQILDFAPNYAAAPFFAGGGNSILSDVNMGPARSFNLGYTPGPNALAWSVTFGGLPVGVPTYHASTASGFNGFIISDPSPNMVGAINFGGQTNASTMQWDNFRFASYAPIVAAAVPEPASLILFAVGTAGLGLLCIRTRTRR